MLVDRVAAIASRKGCSPGQLALAWVMARGPDVFPIPGTRSIANLEVRRTAHCCVLGARGTRRRAVHECVAFTRAVHVCVVVWWLSVVQGVAGPALQVGTSCRNVFGLPE